MGYYSYAPAWDGRIWVDDGDGIVMQVEQQSLEAPREIGGQNRTYTWDYIKIGEGYCQLPVSADGYFTFPAGDEWHLVVQYKNHRRFEAATSITLK
jgi:hypothetical protein